MQNSQIGHLGTFCLFLAIYIQFNLVPLMLCIKPELATIHRMSICQT